ncbi:MAG: Fe-S protein assembly co-chaperone HscB [Acidobacteria bacterium]|nr:Fe-S protein assembly co-chaperone HscB [Acidobacteriota bacterium]
MEAPPSGYYEIFGIEKRLALDVEGLQRLFYERSREWHPDRHARSSPEDRQRAEQATATLNDAWRVLRDPVQRAEYFLKGEGFDIGEQRSKNVPPELLEEVFELNMALEEAREGDGGAKAQVAAALERFAGTLGEVDQERDTLFARYDDSRQPELLAALRTLLNKRKYLQNLVRDARAALD